MDSGVLRVLRFGISYFFCCFGVFKIPGFRFATQLLYYSIHCGGIGIMMFQVQSPYRKIVGQDEEHEGVGSAVQLQIPDRCDTIRPYTYASHQKAAHPPPSPSHPKGSPTP